MIHFTNVGLTQILSMALKGETVGSWDGELLIRVLNASIVFDPTKGFIEDYSWQEGVISDPATFTRSGWSFALMVGPRAVIQWGPPAIVLSCPDAFTAYGLLYINLGDEVFWVDLWATPILIAAEGELQILPSTAMTNECPPLGGCP